MDKEINKLFDYYKKGLLTINEFGFLLAEVRKELIRHGEEAQEELKVNDYLYEQRSGKPSHNYHNELL